MSLVQRVDHAGGVVQLTLANGGGNALNSALIAELHAAIDQLGTARALVLDGGQAKLFSGGFDLTEIVDYDRAQLTTFFGR